MATGSPEKRATSAASTGCGAAKMADPSRPPRGNSFGLVGTGWWGIGASPSSATSAPVRTAIAPDTAIAAPASILRITAWAWGHRTKHAWAWPSRFQSSL